MEKQLKVIIADDKTELAKACADVLREDGMEVVFTAKDGQEVLDAISDKKPDAVIMDMFMPNLDAVGVLDRIDSLLSATPIFALGFWAIQQLGLIVV